MSKGLRCLLCRDVRNTRDGMRDHLADHSRRALAEELLRAAYPVQPTAVKTTTPRPCGKKRWTHEQALNVLIRAALSKSPNRAEKRMYQCARCQWDWHLTKKDERC